MSNRSLLISISLVLLWLQTTHSIAPNILFIIADDLGWGNIGYNSPTNTEIKTPNINQLATKEGLILNRHYVHFCCSPTRTSFQTGRLPVHVNLNNADAASNPYSGASINMTLIAEKLKYSTLQYRTHFIGKWDAGSTTIQQIPIHRGYDSSFGYLSHANTYYTNQEWAHPCTKYGFEIYDLWDSDAPAYNDVDDDIYEEFKFAKRAYALIDDYDNTSNDNPFFIVYSSHISHEPLQIDPDYYDIYDNDEGNCSAHDPFIYPGFNGTYNCRSIEQSMVNLLDIIIGNITQKLKERNLWNNTLVVFTGDNGGCQLLTACAGNNHPLRGGKFVPFEGGIRTATFVSGGYLPSYRYGQIENGMIHIADWYTTLCDINGIDATDYKAKSAGLPPIDGYNVWDLIVGKNNTSPRTEIPINDNVLIQNEYKLIMNTTLNYAGWNGLIYPNSSSWMHSVQHTMLNCSNGCLFDVVNDMTEHNNIVMNNKQIMQQMNDRLVELKKGYFNNNESGTDICPNDINMSCACWVSKNKYNGFYGPYQVITLTDTNERYEA